MSFASAFLTTLILGGFATWGFLAPALDLRRRGEFRWNALLVTWWRLIGLIPQAVCLAVRGAFRHPWTWDGPLFGWVLTVVLVIMLVPLGMLEIVAGDERTIGLVMTPVALYAGLGCGLGLVRDTRRFVDSGPP